MLATISLPASAVAARRARDIRTAWSADPQMPEVHGCAEDAVRVLAIRAAVSEATGGEAALPAPTVVEMTGRLLAAQFPEMLDVIENSGHAVIHGADGESWEPGDYVHQVYTAAFGPAGGRVWQA